MIYTAKQMEEQAIMETASRMCAAARTAPKACGIDNILTLVLTGAEKDTNKDGAVTLEDFKSLFVYSLKNNNLRKVEIKNSTVDSFKFIEKKKDILITFGRDRDADNVYDSEKDPTFIMRYDYVQKSLVPIVDKALEAGIQKIIDKN